MHNRQNSHPSKEHNLRPSEQFLRDMELYQGLSSQGKKEFLATFDTMHGWSESIAETERSEVLPQIAGNLGAIAVNSLKEDAGSAEKPEEGELDRRTELFDFLESQDINIKSLPVVAAIWSRKSPNSKQSLGNQSVALNNLLGKSEGAPDEFMYDTTYIREDTNLKYVQELAARGVSETIATMPAQRTYTKQVNEKVKEQLSFGRTREKIVPRVEEVTEVRTMGDYLGTDDSTPAWLVGYQANTLSRMNPHMARAGGQHGMQIAMPEEQARVLTEWLREDPHRARELADYTLTDVIDYTGGDAPRVSYSDKIKAVRFTSDPRGAVQDSELIPIDHE